MRLCGQKNQNAIDISLA